MSLARKDDPESRAYWAMIDAAAKRTAETAARLNAPRPTRVVNIKHGHDLGCFCVRKDGSGPCHGKPLAAFIDAQVAKATKCRCGLLYALVDLPERCACGSEHFGSWAMAETETTTLHVYKNEGDDFIVAASPEDAAAWSRTEEGGGLRSGDGEGGDPEDWTLVPDDRVFTLREYHANGDSAKKTCAEWAKENGRGFFCSANY